MIKFFRNIRQDLLNKGKTVSSIANLEYLIEENKVLTKIIQQAIKSK
jgi:hypothetical protein